MSEMGCLGCNQEDGLPMYSHGRYEITVEITMTKTIKVDADPNNVDTITKAVGDWVCDNVYEEIEWDYEIEDVEEVEE